MGTLTIFGNAATGLPNGTGNANFWQPTSYSVETTRIGVTLVAANGTRNRVERGTTKRIWTIGWKACNYATKGTVEAIAAVATTFFLADFAGTSYTCQTEDPPDVAWAFNDRAGNTFWDVQIRIFQV